MASIVLGNQSSFDGSTLEFIMKILKISRETICLLQPKLLSYNQRRNCKTQKDLEKQTETENVKIRIWKLQFYTILYTVRIWSLQFYIILYQHSAGEFCCAGSIFSLKVLGFMSKAIL